jgi:hypothetical protein
MVEASLPGCQTIGMTQMGDDSCDRFLKRSTIALQTAIFNFDLFL